MKVAINGFGRIGKLVLRYGIKEKIDWVVNHPKGIESAEHVFKYDSVQGKFPGKIKIEQDNLVIDGKKVKVISERARPEELPWKKLEVDVVIESTGLFRKKEDAEGHIKAGAKKVVISAPGKGDVESFVMGVNSDGLNKSGSVIDNASCTTNCLMPVLRVLNDKFGIEKGFMTTIHGYTGDQNLVDGTHKDPRRARAAAVNIIPTTTGATKAAGKVIPALKGKLDGKAIRVPVPTGSLVDVTVILGKETSVDEVNSAMKKASEGYLKGILEYTEEPIVSTDIIGNTHSSIFDAELTKVLGNMVQVVSWYDNEAGYSKRTVDLVKSLKL
ncbi:MAG: type I glyceraldehyde-3-phosphate dehydrogenase [Candidatus Diapherotrites archaeon]